MNGFEGSFIMSWDLPVLKVYPVLKEFGFCLNEGIFITEEFFSPQRHGGHRGHGLFHHETQRHGGFF
jgi:hypothetical protein